YAITVTNRGGTPAEPTLTDKVPTDTTYAGEGEGWETCVKGPPPSPAGTACTQKVPVPAATTTTPAEVTKTFTVKVDQPPLPSGTTQITNFVHSSQGPSSATELPTEPACEAKTGLTPAQLETTKKLAKVNGIDVPPLGPTPTVLPGDTLTYAITVTNRGGTPAEPTLTDKVPTDTTYAGEGEGWETCVKGPPPSPAGTACTQKVPVPAATTTGGPGKATVHFTVKVDNPLTSPASQITNTVHSSQGTCSTAPETEPGCTVGTSLTPAELTTTKTLVEVNGKEATPGQTLLPGDTLTYAITIENEGAAAEPTL